MSKTKFVEITTNGDFKTVNVKNIALIETIGLQTVVTLNITDDYGKFIKINSTQYHNDLSEKIANL